MMEQTTPGFVFYRDLLQEMYTKQKFRSVLAGSIRAATEGLFAGSEIPDYLLDRVRPNELFLWPLMSMIWAFNPATVAARYVIVNKLC